VDTAGKTRPTYTAGQEVLTAAENYMGAQLSEVLNADVTSSEENSFSRRRVVKGVAWSLPVIATAIAAPAAAASPTPISATAALVGPATPNITFVSSTGTGTGTSRTGTGPTAFQIHNTGSAITGSITGTVNIKPSGTVTAGAGIQSITPAVLSSPAYTGTFEYNASFTYAGSIASGQTLNFPIAFQYQRVTPLPANKTFTYTLTITLRLPDGTDRVMTGTVTVTY
jgi:hypothetical protein